ncbi:bifunctional phosphoribosyl-AMP cyclohydrolase/phosphoribosyl-ATP diphosphatase HisIE [Campylobacter fetus]|nr:bifunctional phosphoribosyl-AMP cyclohydrolase/phosphoribosyl-ATP diphosphatase HisIE [Campylobacter fetus]
MCVNWDKVAGLLPVTVQEYSSNEVLMMAYMNEAAFNLSIETGFAHYFSRTKNRIWKKGEESGNFQIIKFMALDCDNDALLIKVEQIGDNACHTGAKSCFFNEISANKANLNNNQITHKYDILDHLYHIALDRKLNKSENSYISKLYQKGENSYLKKICEEAGEFGFAIKDLSKFKKYAELNKESFGEHIDGKPDYDAVYEAADMLFHLIVALADFDIHPARVLDELKRREGISGIEEKNARSR